MDKDRTVFRQPALVRELAAALNGEARGLGPLKVMHVCGTHEHEIGRYALRKLLPSNLALVAGPGCPVCITPASAIATIMHLALSDKRPVVCAYGDIVRVPVEEGSLLATRKNGADVRIVIGPRDAIRTACENPDRPVVFFSVGFETTAAGVASLLAGRCPDNFFVYCCHRYVPAALQAIAADPDNPIDGYLLPGHASVITGARAYAFLPERFDRPAAIAGFEPVDILSGLLSLVRQIRTNRPAVANCYPRAVRTEGNLRAQEAMDRVFFRSDASWRGIGVLPDTGLILRKGYAQLDALTALGMEERQAQDKLPGCSCHLVIMGRSLPEDCKLFKTACTPEDPKGPCMVGAEGTCRARYLFPEDEDV